MMEDRIFKLIYVICYIWYFYVIFVILGLGHLFPYFLVFFNVVQSNQGFICFRSHLRVSNCPRFCFHYLNALQPPRQFSLQTIINKNRRFVKFSSGGFQFYSPCGFRETPCGFKVYYQELTVQFLFHQESIVYAFFRLPRHQLVSEP